MKTIAKSFGLWVLIGLAGFLGYQGYQVDWDKRAQNNKTKQIQEHHNWHSKLEIKKQPFKEGYICCKCDRFWTKDKTNYKNLRHGNDSLCPHCGIKSNIKEVSVRVQSRFQYQGF